MCAKTAAITKRLILPATNKGGSGKTTILTQFLEWLATEHSGVRYCAFDPDVESPRLSRIMATEGVGHPNLLPININEEQALDVVWNSLTLGNHFDLAVVDGVGSMHDRLFGRWIKEMNLFDSASEAKIAVTFLAVVEDQVDLVDQVVALMERTPTGAGIDWLVVLNERHVEAGQMKYWNLVGRPVAERLKASVVTFPRFYGNLSAIASSDKAKPLARMLSLPPEQVSPADKLRIKGLLRHINSTFAQNAGILLPS